MVLSFSVGGLESCYFSRKYFQRREDQASSQHCCLVAQLWGWDELGNKQDGTAKLLFVASSDLLFPTNQVVRQALFIQQKAEILKGEEGLDVFPKLPTEVSVVQW